MGSSGEPDVKGIDASVGGLVWVRRRNGSWWPGRIIGLDELSEDSLVSPRSGTPVKLLGRDDAIVDWYNLEKSKRVKAFRCGEYNEWIEKAKASMSNSNRKAVKYARRENAIIHALEIESACLGKDHPDYFCRKDNSGGDEGSLAGESHRDVTDETSESEVDADSALDISQSGVSFKEPNHINGTKGDRMLVKRRKTPNDSEDDGKERTKRMRGLEDLGMGVGSKGKVQDAGLLKLAQQDNCLSHGGSVNGIGNHSSSLKRKRTQVTNVHEFLKRKYRRRPLTKVLESTAVVSVPVVCDELPSSNVSPVREHSDCKVLGMDSNESGKSVSAIMNNYNNDKLDSTGVSCENGFSLNASEHAVDPDASHMNDKSKDNEISSVPRLAENSSSDRLFDVPFVGEDKPFADFSPIFVSCSSEKPEVDNLGRQAEIERRNEASCIRSVDVSQMIEKGTMEWQLKGKRKPRQTSKNQKQDSRKYAHMDDDHLNGFYQGSDRKIDCNGAGGSVVVEDKLDGFQDWKSMSWEPCAIPRRPLAHFPSRYTVQSRYQMTDFSGKACFADSSLYDVKIEVKADYRPQHVPLVSLISKLNRKAIVGHPLTVEVRTDDFHGNLIREDAVECTETAHLVKRNSGGGERVPRKHKKSRSRKSTKAKKSRLLSKKTRRLSSLAGQKVGVAEWKSVVQKPESSVITCVPLKLVFSRINEALNGSGRHIHRRSTSGSS